MKKIKLYIHSDGGHGWLAVKRGMLKSLGIENKISRCSYQRGNTVYLEEDVDLSTFFTAYCTFNKLERTKLTDHFEIIDSYKDYSPIRNYERYYSTNLNEVQNENKQ
jgi:hypothetical protein